MANDFSGNRHWTDAFESVGDTLAGLGAAFAPYFAPQQQPQQPPPYYYPPTPPPPPPPPYEPEQNPPPYTPPRGKKSQTGKIILFSALGLVLLGTTIYLVTKKPAVAPAA